MSTKKRRGPCYRCGAELTLANCPPSDITVACDDCGQCYCLRRYTEDYRPETDWTLQ